MDWILSIIIAFAGVALAMTRSTRAVDFVVFLFVFNRGLRRIVDYYVNGGLTPLSPISLTPLVVTGALLVPVILSIHQLPRRSAPVFFCLLGAIAYAFMIGYFSVKIAAVYALAEALAPLALFAYILLIRPSREVKDRWVRSFAWAAILASAYGWYQFWTIPPWDGAWLIQSNMVGYMGIPEPTQMTVFSTMAERGPLASYLGLAVVPMIVAKRWRPLPGVFGWAGVILVFSIILQTFSRTGIIMAIVGCVAYVLINRGKGFWQIAIGVLVLGGAGMFFMEKMPNAERLTERLETFENMQEDSSLQGRLQIMEHGPALLLQTPQGYGLGAWGLATRVNTGTTQTEARVMDAGPFDLALVFGLPGFALLAAAMAILWSVLSERFRTPQTLDEHVYLARAFFITVLIGSFVGNILMNFSILWLAFGCGLVVNHPVPRRSPPPRGQLGRRPG